MKKLLLVLLASFCTSAFGQTIIEFPSLSTIANADGFFVWDNAGNLNSTTNVTFSVDKERQRIK